MSDHAAGDVDIAVIERTLRSRHLLGQPAVIEAFEAVMADLRDQIVAQAPTAQAMRESLYHQHLGLQLVLGQLKAWETQAQADEQSAMAQE
jgi:hypothetical protein